MESNEIKKCSKTDCDPKLQRGYCCGNEYAVTCHCGKLSEPMECSEWTVEDWNNRAVNEEGGIQ